MGIEVKEEDGGAYLNVEVFYVKEERESLHLS